MKEIKLELLNEAYYRIIDVIDGDFSPQDRRILLEQAISNLAILDRLIGREDDEDKRQRKTRSL